MTTLRNRNIILINSEVAKELPVGLLATLDGFLLGTTDNKILAVKNG